MNKERFILFCLPAFMIVLFFCSGFALSDGGVGIGYFSPVKKQGDEIITLSYYDEDNQLITLSCQTGQPGSKHTGDDLPKGMSGSDKAQRIADAINQAHDPSGASYPVSAHATGHVVTVGVVRAGKGIKKFKVTNNTRQIRNKQSVSKSYGDGEAGHQESYIYLSGRVMGLDDDLGASEIHIGTDHYQAALHPMHPMSIEKAARELVRDLVNHRVAASLVLPTVIRIILDDEQDGKTHYGCSDAGMDMTIETLLIME